MIFLPRKRAKHLLVYLQPTFQQLHRSKSSIVFTTKTAFDTRLSTHAASDLSCSLLCNCQTEYFSLNKIISIKSTRHQKSVLTFLKSKFLIIPSNFKTILKIDGNICIDSVGTCLAYSHTITSLA